jgi:hypothetical protein
MKSFYLRAPSVKKHVSMEHAVNECKACCSKGPNDGQEC